MGVTFGTPVVNHFPGSARSTFDLVMSGVTSGQPILLFWFGWIGSGVTGIADTFSTPYTWTRVETNSNTGNTVELWIGTGGVGTSGTITVTKSGDHGGIAVPCDGASTAAGLLAIDSSDTNDATSTTIAPPTLTPSAADQGALYGWGGTTYDPSDYPDSPWVSTDLDYSPNPTVIAGIATYESPAAASLATTWTATSGVYAGVSAIVKAADAGAAAFTPKIVLF